MSGTSKKSSLGVLAENGNDDNDDDARKLLNGLEGMDLGDSDDDDDAASVSASSDADSTFSPTVSGSASSNLSSGHALAQRRRDEKRLMLDLSKHRQLLIDSETMNSSIRRCMAWSDEMIKEGRRALGMKVKVGGRVLNGSGSGSEDEDAITRLGGRVLHDISGSEDEGGKRGVGLVSPSRLIGTMEAEGLWVDAQRRGKMQAEGEDAGGGDEPD